jgi:hypothetical protein
MFFAIRTVIGVVDVLSSGCEEDGMRLVGPSGGMARKMNRISCQIKNESEISIPDSGRFHWKSIYLDYCARRRRRKCEKKSGSSWGWPEYGGWLYVA